MCEKNSTKKLITLHKRRELENASETEIEIQLENSRQFPSKQI